MHLYLLLHYKASPKGKISYSKRGLHDFFAFVIASPLLYVSTLFFHLTLQNLLY